jgi:iron complex outermembrane recepter protein
LPTFVGRITAKLLLLTSLVWLTSAGAAFAAGPREPVDMSLEELSHLVVTTVSRRPQSLAEAASAIQVITSDAIRRSGATSIPEALRLASNLQVAQINGNNWAISARGFNSTLANKLLVMIDGRTIYSPLFAGTFWEAQDVPLYDVDRIEVISGPGATLWGANAMNGVINVITRSARQTGGTLLQAAGGNQDSSLGARFGAPVQNALSYRVYALGFNRESLELADGSSAHDRWRKAQAGFRADWTPAADLLTVQGDAYRGTEDQFAGQQVGISGANLLGRWRHATPLSQWQLQAYLDHSEAGQPINGAGFVLNIYDLEVQQSLALGRYGAWVWGVGERVSDYHIENSATLLFLPSHRALNLTNIFAQGTFDLSAKLQLIAGVKLEDDPYSHWTAMPDIRVSWMPAPTSTVWAAASRAVRSPTPFDVDIVEKVGTTVFLTGNAAFRTEKLTAYEIGYRTQLGDRLSLSAATFYNVYQDLRTIEPAPAPDALPFRWDNGMAGRTYGTMLWADVQLTSWWRLSPAFRSFHERLHFKPGASGLLGLSQAGDDPATSASLKSSMTLERAWSLDATLRHVSEFPDPRVPAYYELSARLAWRLSDAWQLAVTGNNLLHRRHLEYEGAEFVPRSFMLEVRLQR